MQSDFARHVVLRTRLSRSHPLRAQLPFGEGAPRPGFQATLEVNRAALIRELEGMDRSRYAGLTLEGLAPGEWRELRREEIAALRALTA